MTLQINNLHIIVRFSVSSFDSEIRTSVVSFISSTTDVLCFTCKMPELKDKPKIDSKTNHDDKKVHLEDTKKVPDSVAETVADPFCDEKNPRIITFQDVCQAAFMIKGGIDLTPCRV